MAEVVIVESPEAGGALVARHIATQVRADPEFTLGVATGSTPLPVYSALADEREAGLDLSAVSAFALDEYVGLAREHTESYHRVIQREVTDPLGLDPSRVDVPDSDEATVSTAGARYETASRRTAGWICSCWASARTVTWASTSPAPRWHR